MPKPEWFRRTTWTAEDRKEFFLRLGRSRLRGRAQYLRIQAFHLFEGGTAEGTRGALELLELLLEKYPERSELSTAYLQKAECLNRLGEFQGAEVAFHSSLDIMRTIPNVRNNAELQFGLFVAEHRITRLYEEALAALDEFERDLVFPFQQYLYFGAKAVILARQGHEEVAKSLAAKAIEAFQKRHSGLTRHPTVGIVSQPNPIIHRELTNILS